MPISAKIISVFNAYPRKKFQYDVCFTQKRQIRLDLTFSRQIYFAKYEVAVTSFNVNYAL